MVIVSCLCHPGIDVIRTHVEATYGKHAEGGSAESREGCVEELGGDFSFCNEVHVWEITPVVHNLPYYSIYESRPPNAPARHASE